MRSTCSSLPLIAAALMMSATAQAATNAGVPCEQVGRDLQSLDVAVNELAVEAVDHTAIDADIIDEESVVRESVTPVLNLGPRVTNILRNVFDTTTEELLQESSDQPSSPLAEADEEKDAVESHDATRDEPEISRFQRRMLRTDI